MDRSLSSSTGSLIQTPTRANATTSATPIYPNLTANSNISPVVYSSGRNVRFVESSSSSSSDHTGPQQSTRRSNLYGTPYASAPPSRIQNNNGNNAFANGLFTATPPKTRLSVSGSSSSLATAGGARAASNSSPGSSVTQHQSQNTSGFRFSNLPLAQKVAAPLAAAPKLAAEKLTPDIVKSRQAPPLGRAEAAKRLRVNAVLLVIWWLSSRTHVYK